MRTNSNNSPLKRRLEKRTKEMQLEKILDARDNESRSLSSPNEDTDCNQSMAPKPMQTKFKETQSSIGATKNHPKSGF